LTLLFSLALSGALPVMLAAQSGNATIPRGTLAAGTTLSLELTARTGIHHIGQTIDARLTEPVYADNRMLLPAGTHVTGIVAAIHGPAFLHRLQSASSGDFSPAPAVAIRFDAITLGDESYAMLAAPAPDMPVLHMATVATVKPSIAASLGQRASAVYHQQEDAFESLLQQQTKWATVKGEMVASLPYRPASLPAGATYTVRLLAPLTLPDATPVPAIAPPGTPMPDSSVLRAHLDTSLSSATSQWGQPARATLDEPLLAASGAVILPQGTQLEGKVVEAHAARWFNRGGRLRFRLDQVELPPNPAAAATAPTTVAINAQLAAVATDSPITLNAEGETQPQKPSQAKTYLALGVLALTAGHGDADNSWQLDAGSGAASRFKLWNFLVPMAMPRVQPVALAFGFVATGHTLYDRFIARGRNIAFPAGTRLAIRLSAHQK
jgi:hypothetical protein